MSPTKPSVRHIDQLSDLLRVSEVAHFFDSSEGLVRSLLKSGALVSVRLGRLTRITRESVRRLAQGTKGR